MYLSYFLRLYGLNMGADENPKKTLPI